MGLMGIPTLLRQRMRGERKKTDDPNKIAPKELVSEPS
jgi:hypothetical protein